MLTKKPPREAPRPALAALLLAAVIAAGPTAQQREPHAFLQKYAGLAAEELVEVDRGEPVARVLDRSDRREVAVVGVIRVRVSVDTFVARFRDIATYKKSDAVLEIGKFSDPPRLADLAGLTLDEADVAALRKCASGDCSIRVLPEAGARLANGIDWDAPSARARATALIRRMLLAYVQAYRVRGSSALAEYRDEDHTLRLADDFTGLLAASPYIADYVPEFQAYLEQYPRGTLEGADDFIYWSKEKFAARSVVSVTHVTIYRKPGATSDVLISSKQIFASRYFDSSLGLTALVSDRGPASGAAYLVYVNRSRAEHFRGGLGGMLRGIVEREAVAGLERYLELVRDRLEASQAGPERRGRSSIP